MTLLPIVARELRVGARQAWPRWSRVIMVGVGAALSLQALIGLELRGRSAVGPALLHTLGWVIFLLAGGAFVVTADGLSRERREGTLGLLFLTDLRGHDVVLGKLSGAALKVLYLLAGFVPLLMFPVLAGGVTWTEAARLGFAVLNVAFFSVAIGVWCSSRAAQLFAVFRGVCGSLLLMGLLPLLVWSFGGDRGWAALSPWRAFSLSLDATYTSAANSYWISIAMGQFLGWLAIAGACLTLTRNWRQEFKLKGLRNQVLWRRELRRRRQQGSSMPALGWLNRSYAPVACAVLRIRGLRAAAWAGGVLMLLAELSGAVLAGFFPGMISSGLVMGLHLLAAGCFAWMAGRFFVDARSSGELELLMTTPAGASGIIRDQWFSLMRLLRGPVVLVVLGALPRAAYSVISVGMSRGPELAAVFAAALGLVNSVLGVLAVCWVALWLAATLQRPGGYVLWTLVLAELAASIGLSLGLTILFRMLGAGGGMVFAWGFWLLSWPVLLLLKNLILLWLAQRQLREKLRAPGLRALGLRRFQRESPVGLAHANLGAAREDMT